MVCQGQKACGNLAAIVCGPSSCCIVSNRTVHLHHLTVPTSKKRNPPRPARTTTQWESQSVEEVTGAPGWPWPLVRQRWPSLLNMAQFYATNAQEHGSRLQLWWDYFSRRAAQSRWSKAKKLWSLGLGKPLSWNVHLNGQKLQQLTDTAKVNAHNLSHTLNVAVQQQINSRQIDEDLSVFKTTINQWDGVGALRVKGERF